jgi:hypothetical protein
MNAQTPMSGQTMPTNTGPDTTSGQAPAQPGGGSRALRILALAAVCTGVAALAAATFVLSYSALHTVALQAGIAPRLARGYPLVLDAMLVIVLAAVLALRGAGLPSRLLAWTTLLVVLVAAAGPDAMHAAGRRLPASPARITAAVLPWVLVLIAFALLLLMLRHFRLRRQASARSRVVPHGPARAHWQPPDPRVPPGVPAPGLASRPGGPVPPGWPGPGSPAAGQAPVAPAPPTRPLPVMNAAVPAAIAPGPAVAAEPGPGAAEPLAEPVAAEPLTAGNGTPETAAADPAPAEPVPADPAGTGSETDPDEAPAPRSYSVIQPVLSVPRQPGPAAAADADPEFASQHAELAIDAELSPDDPSSDEAAGSSGEETSTGPASRADADAGDRIADGSPAGDTTLEGASPAAAGEPADPADAAATKDPPPAGEPAGPDTDDQPGQDTSQAPEQDPAAEDEQPDPDMPVFHRMWSSPTPPSGM